MTITIREILDGIIEHVDKFDREVPAFQDKLRRLLLVADNTITWFAAFPLLAEYISGLTKDKKECARSDDRITKVMKTADFGAALHCLEAINELTNSKNIRWSDKSVRLMRLYTDEWKGWGGRRNYTFHVSSQSEQKAEDDYKRLHPQVIALLSELREILGESELRAINITCEVGNFEISQMKLKGLVSREIPFPFCILREEPQSRKGIPLFLRKQDDNIIEFVPLPYEDLNCELKVKRSERATANLFSALRGAMMLDAINPHTRSSAYITNFESAIKHLTEHCFGRAIYLKVLKEWALESYKSMFFVIGPPGIGKSTIAARFYELLRDSTEFNRVESVVAIYLVNKAYQGRVTAATILRHFTAIICHKMADERGPFPEDRDVLLNILEKICARPEVQTPRKLALLIIDGFDELSEYNRIDLLGILKKLCDLDIKVCVFSQSVIELPIGQADLQLNYDDDNILSDVRLSTEAALSTIALSERDRVRATDVILEKASGNFLYQCFMVSDLKQGVVSVDELERYPPKLCEYYCKLLNELQESFDSHERFLELGLPVLTLLIEYGRPISIEKASVILDVERKWVRFVVKNFRRILHESTSDDDKSFSYCHQSVVTYLRQYEYVRDERARVAGKILAYAFDFYSSDKYVLERFVDWAQDAQLYSAVDEYLQDSFFVERWMLHHRTLAHPSDQLDLTKFRFESDKQKLEILLRLHLTVSEQNKLAYASNEHRLAGIMWEKPRIIDWMRQHKFFPKPMGRCLATCSKSEYNEIIEGIFTGSMTDDLSSFADKLSGLWKQYYDMYFHEGLTQDYIDILELTSTHIEAFLRKHCSECRELSSFRALAVTAAVANRWLWLLAEIADRERRFGREVPVFISTYVVSLTNAVLESQFIGPVLVGAFVPNLPPMLEYLADKDRWDIALTVEANLKKIQDGVLKIFEEAVSALKKEKPRNPGVPLDELFDVVLKRLRWYEGDEADKLLERLSDIISADAWMEDGYAAFVQEIRESGLDDAVLGPAMARCSQNYVDSWPDVNPEIDGPLTELIDVPWSLVLRFLQTVKNIPISDNCRRSMKHWYEYHCGSKLEMFPIFRVCYGGKESFWDGVESGSFTAMRYLNTWSLSEGSLLYYYPLATAKRQYRSEPEDVRILCNLKYNEDCREVREPATEEEIYRARDKVINQVISQFRLSADPLVLLVSRYHDKPDRFEHLLIRNLDPADPHSKKTVGEYFVSHLERWWDEKSRFDDDWWSDSGDWTWAEEHSYRSEVGNDATNDVDDWKSYDEYSNRALGYDLIFVWHHLCIHNRAAVVDALTILKEKCFCDGTSDSGCEPCMFVGYFVVAVQMLDKSLREEYKGIFQGIYLDRQLQTSFPDREDFFNYFFAMSDSDFERLLNQDFQNSVASDEMVWQVLTRDVKKTLCELYELSSVAARSSNKLRKEEVFDFEEVETVKKRFELAEPGLIPRLLEKLKSNR